MLWLPAGSLGIATDYDATIRSVDPGGPADRVGIVAGDRVLLTATPLLERRYVAGAGAIPRVGEVVRFTLLHGALIREVQLTTVEAPASAADHLALFLECASSVVFIIVGAGLILKRPSPATWGFGLYCLLILPTGAYATLMPATVWAVVATGVFDVVQNLGVVGLVLFALEFPRPFPGPLRERVRALLPAMFVALVAMTLYPDAANVLFGVGAGLENLILQLAFGATFALAIVLLFDTFRRIEADERERIRWVLAGFCLGLVTNYIGNTLIFSTLIAANPPAWLASLLVSLNVLLPVTVAYAVVRHRVLDIDFVIGRALGFTIMTAILAGVFGILDWFFGSILEDFRFTRVVQAAISISIAFAFNRLEKRVHHAIEAVFFRKRRAAEARLDLVIRALPQARSIAIIEESLTAEAIGALELTSAALFRRNDGASFARTASSGWSEGDCRALDDTDMLVLALRSERGSVDIDALAWRRADIPADARKPIAAIPMRSHGELLGFTLYGGHANGAGVDPGEIDQLVRLAAAASLAFDQLDADRVRAENVAQSATIVDLRARLDELRHAR